MSKTKLQQLLTSRLSLKQPKFLFEKAGAELSGSVISETFEGKTTKQRQRMVWDRLTPNWCRRDA
jgi:acid stress-induced BolA-like protein IbaG/YrbA